MGGSSLWVKEELLSGATMSCVDHPNLPMSHRQDIRIYCLSKKMKG